MTVREYAETAGQQALDADAAREWARRPAEVETVLLLDPDTSEADRIIAEVGRLGVQMIAEAEPFRAIARAGMGGVDLLIVNASIGGHQLEALVSVIRQEVSIPVLLAYGASDLQDIGPAVVAGARPVVTTPYEARDLVRALRAAMPPSTKPTRVRLGQLAISPDTFDVSFDGQSIDLSPLEFSLLLLLARNANRAIARTVLIRALWPDSSCVNPEDLLGAVVSRIRRKLRPLGVEDALHTVRGYGYRLDEGVLTPSRGIWFKRTPE